jgi:hypothetical protein
MSIGLRRREFIAGLGGAAVLPLAARAQQRAMPVVGWAQHPEFRNRCLRVAGVSPGTE